MTEYSPTPAAQSAASDDGGGTSVKDRATEASQAAKHAGTDVAQTAAEKAKDVAQETTKQARDLLGEARGQLKQQTGDQHRALVANLRSLADELSAMTNADEQGGVATQLVGQAGERVQGAANWLDGREPGDVLEEVRAFARRRPGTFLLGAALAGVVAGRLTRGVVAVRSDESSGSSQSAVPHGDTAPQVATATTTQFAPATDYETEVIGYSAPATDAPSSYGTAPASQYGTQYSAPPASQYGTEYGTPPRSQYGTEPASQYGNGQSDDGDGFSQPGQHGGGI
jgi:hypothetical protein